MDLQLIIDILPAFLSAAWTTVWISVLAIQLGALSGFALNVMQMLWPRVAPIYRSYVWLIRGTPFLAQLFVLYFGLPQLGVTLDAVQATVIGLTLYGAAYFAEIFRAAWQSIPRGQIEAGKVFGMSRLHILRRIEVPQVCRLAIPMLTNQAILILKESSVASIITVPELTKTAGTIVADTFSYAEPYLLLGLIYWVLALSFGFAGHALERISAPVFRKDTP
ncbi:amino acid ABC transporter permease [Noviherbaspirillum sp. CPCC 100848]|uniref:Amino acid ABC transporter permease n=1 Tax=Noviherbaspirillum album TaxID=3080276 RepID=A0ABU6JGT1_9BURK|nr:amino acid ABC transporter permease [Noviherbaspirillum sp. CPCC 100848]MEC4722730.1 amino acid ABC transporter permease [Noviherbaspirillum sp. CPCC 100848]